MNIEEKIGNLPALRNPTPDELPEPTTPFRMIYFTSCGDVELVESKDGLDDIAQVEEIVRTVMTEHYFKKMPIKVIAVTRRALMTENNFRLELALHRCAAQNVAQRIKDHLDDQA